MKNWRSDEEEIGAKSADHGSGLVRKRNVQINLLLLILSVVMISLWVETTYTEVSSEVEQRTVRSLNQSIVPMNMFFRSVLQRSDTIADRLREEAQRVTAPGAVLPMLPQVNPSRTDYHVLLQDNGEPVPGWRKIVMPPEEVVQDMIHQVRHGRSLALSLPYDDFGSRFASVLREIHLDDRPGYFLVQTFSVERLREIWNAMQLPYEHSVSLQLDTGQLWLEKNFNRELPGTRVPYDLTDIIRNNEFAEHTDYDGMERLITARPLQHMNLRLVIGVPAQEKQMIWENRYLVSVFFAIGACAIVMTVMGLGASSVNREITKREEAVIAMQDSQRRLQDIADAASDWFWELDSDFRFVYLSSRLVEVSGLEPDDYIGQTLTSFKEGYISDDLDRTLKSRLPFRDVVFEVRNRQGSIRVLRLSGQPVFTQHGIFSGYRGVGTDVTAEREAAKVLEAAQSRLFRAFESFTGGISLYNADDVLVSFNRRFAELFFPTMGYRLRPGMTFEEVLNLYILEAQDPRASRYNRLFKTYMLRHRGRMNQEIRMPDNVWLSITDHKTPEGDLFTVYTDITDYKRREKALLDLSQENQRLAAAVSATDSGVFIADMGQPGSPVVYQNPAFTRLTGYRPGEVQGFHNRFLLSDETINGVAEQRFQQVLGGSDHVTVDMLTARKDGSSFWTHLNLSRVGRHRGQGRYLVGILYDITENKNVERELTELKESAEIASRSKSEFLAMMSHELRTPLNAILGFSEIISEQMFGEVGDDRYVSYSRDIHSSGKHLLDLINDILDLSKAEAGKIDLFIEELDVVSILERCCSMLRGRANENSLTLTLESSVDQPGLVADERRLKQVLINLISNAVKFTPEGGSITVSARQTERGFELAVADTGIGIAEDDMEKAMIPFGQVDSSLARRHEGTGLGLPLSKRLVELHGAEFELESKLGKGTTARIVFPISALVNRAA